MKNVFEKLRTSEPVDMSAPEYQDAINEMKRTTQICARLNDFPLFAEGTEVIENEIFNEPMGEGSYITPPFSIDFGNQVKIGSHVFINHHLTMMSAGSITIDDGVMIGPNVNILTDNHDFANRMVLVCKPIHICKNAWIGAGAMILPGVTVGENAVVGSGAIVTHDVEPNTVVAGNPAKVIKKL